MKKIDSYLSELPEPERTLCLEARAKAKKREPDYHDGNTAKSTADAIMFGFDWRKDGSDYFKFSAIHTRAKAGEFEKPAKKRDAKGGGQGKPKKAAPKKRGVATTVLEAMEARIMDRLEALRMGQMDQDVSETLNRIEGSVNSHGSAIAMAQGHIVQRLTALESSVAVIRSGATFMQQLEKDAPKGLQTGDYCDASKEVADALTAMGWGWHDEDRCRLPFIEWSKGLSKKKVVNTGHLSKEDRTHLDRPTFLTRARVTAQELGLQAVEPEAWVPQVGDWVVWNAENPSVTHPPVGPHMITKVMGLHFDIGRKDGHRTGEYGMYDFRPATPEEIAAHEAAQEQVRVQEKLSKLKFGVRVSVRGKDGLYHFNDNDEPRNHWVAFPDGETDNYPLHELTILDPVTP